MKIIDGSKLRLEEFISTLLSSRVGMHLAPPNHFPTDKMLDEFLVSIKLRSDKEVKDILRAFFIKNSTFESDLFKRKHVYENVDWIAAMDSNKVDGGIRETEYYRRIMAHKISRHCVGRNYLDH